MAKSAVTWGKGMNHGLEVESMASVSLDGIKGAHLLADTYDNYIGVALNQKGKGYEAVLCFDKMLNRLTLEQLQALAIMIIGTNNNKENLMKLGFQILEY